MRVHRLGGATAIAAAMLLAAAANVVPVHFAGGSVGVIRHILSVPVLVLPGWSICLALFGDGTLTITDRLAISGSMTLAVLVILGLGLNALPGGLDQTSWTWSLIGVTLAASLAAILTRGPGASSARGLTLPPLGVSVGALVALALMFVGFAFARHSAQVHDSATRFTAFWTLPGSSPRSIRYGVTNRQGRSERYVLIVRADMSNRKLLQSRSFSLVAGGSRAGTLSLPHRAPSVVRLDLYRSGKTQGPPYRSTRLVLR